jgi:hypothetical protein
MSHHATNGSPPEVVARAVHHALTSRRPKTRYAIGAGAKRVLLMRRLLTDRSVDRLILKMTGIASG